MTAIRIEHLSKQYRLGLIGGKTLQDDLQGWWAQVWGKPNPLQKIGEESNGNNANKYIWALRDVNLEVNEGEILGIIGRNGAGKSTLLKILSQIMAPTSGCAKIKGRVASLLEVGTGFHPELTGRENIYLNGMILGMTKKEISRKLDEIVAFSEIERFIDTPVKRYSSGMNVRLAFAVAAHLEPEILLIDEVLAVGDVAFQKKCLGKMEDVSTKEGRTILFVSHNMSMITSLCTRACLIDTGKMTEDGLPSDVVLKYYTHDHMSPASVDFTKFDKRIGDDYAQLLGGYIKNNKGEIATEIDIREPVIVGVHYKIVKQKEFKSFFPYSGFHFFSANGECAFYSTPLNVQAKSELGEYTAECHIPGNLLNSDTYFVSFGFADCDSGVTVHFNEHNALCFHIVEPIDEILTEARNGFSGIIPGVVRPQLKWTVKKQ